MAGLDVVLAELCQLRLKGLVLGPQRPQLGLKCPQLLRLCRLRLLQVGLGHLETRGLGHLRILLVLQGFLEEEKKKLIFFLFICQTDSWARNFSEGEK